jgi:hypothetical protein
MLLLSSRLQYEVSPSVFIFVGLSLEIKKVWTDKGLIYIACNKISSITCTSKNCVVRVIGFLNERPCLTYKTNPVALSPRANYTD